jgi:L-serine dehydratase
VCAELFGALGATSQGDGNDRTVILGLEGERPETVDIGTFRRRASAVRDSGRISLRPPEVAD